MPTETARIANSATTRRTDRLRGVRASRSSPPSPTRGAERRAHLLPRDAEAGLGETTGQVPQRRVEPPAVAQHVGEVTDERRGEVDRLVELVLVALQDRQRRLEVRQ